MIKVTVDFETRSEAPLKKCGAFEYSMHGSSQVCCVAFKRNDAQKVYLFGFGTMQSQFDTLPADFRHVWKDWIASPRFVFSAHNAFFEQCIYNNILVRRFGWPAIPIRKWRCTAAKAAACAIPRNLGDAGAVMRTTTQKDYEGHRVMMKLCKPTLAWNKWHKAWSQKYAWTRGQHAKWAHVAEPVKFHEPDAVPEDFQMLYKYCKIDVVAEEKLDASLPDLSPKEQELWFADQEINLRGVQVDMPLVNKISQIMTAESKVMAKELDILTMGLVSSGNARNAILDFLTLEGVELPNLRAKTVDDFLANGQVTGDAKTLLEIRRALSKSSTAKYKKFLERAATDGRVRDIVLYHAASTGRWGGVGIQPQNFPRGVIKDIFEAIERIKTCNLSDLKMLYGENLMPLFSSVLRGMFIASPGHDLFAEDYSAIECRVTWWLAGHEEGLKMFRDGRDPYREMAAIIFKKSILDITDEERQVGKAAVLGCGFQMGNKKFIKAAWDVYRAKVDSKMAKIAVTAYREVHYPVTELWEAYNEAAIEATENKGQRFRVGRVLFYREGRFLKMELPSGRRLSYADPQIKWDDTFVMTKKIRGTKTDNAGGLMLTEEIDTMYCSTQAMLKIALDEGYERQGVFKSKRLAYWAVNQMAKKEDCIIPKWTLERTYGGKLLENAVQSASRDILAESIVRAKKRGFKVLMHSHDELVSEAPKGKFTGQDYKKVMEEIPAWAAGLPIKSSGWVGDRYRKG